MVTQSYSIIKPPRLQESEVIAVTMAIKALREAKGYSPGELAQMMGVSRPAVVKWETGKSSPRSDKLPLLAQILGVEVGQLYTQHTS